MHDTMSLGHPHDAFSDFHFGSPPQVTLAQTTFPQECTPFAGNPDLSQNMGANQNLGRQEPGPVPKHGGQSETAKSPFSTDVMCEVSRLWWKAAENFGEAWVTAPWTAMIICFGPR
jgi:hypothetical protein